MNYLSKKQIDFCNNVIDGQKLEDAYANAGYRVDNQPPATIRKYSSRLIQKPEIKDYIDRQREALARVTQITKEKTLIEISDVIQTAVTEYKENKDPAQAQVFFRGMDMINRMLGHYEATKTEHTGNININFSIPEPEYVEMKKDAVELEPLEKEDI